MIIYFSIYTFLGYLMESLYISYFQKKLISSGLLKGPFIPLYGFGACILIALSPIISHSLILTFFIGGICMTLLEYFSSLYIEKYFHTQCWNYSHHRLQYQGRICFMYFIIWCCLSVAFIYVIHPFICLYFHNQDMYIMISLIYILFISKAFFSRRLMTNKGLDIH